MWSPKDVSHHDLGINCDKTQISQITIQINRALAGSVLKKSISSPIDLCILSTTACQGWYFSTRAYEFLFLVRLFLDERWENGNSCFLSFHVEKLRHCRPVSSGLPINPKHNNKYTQILEGGRRWLRLFFSNLGRRRCLFVQCSNFKVGCW